MNHSSIIEQGMNHIWLPYAQMQTAPMPFEVKSTEGVNIYLQDGRTLVDGTASWWSACHGYSHPHLVQAVQQQAADLPHIMFAGLAHQPAYKLASRLASLAPGNLDRVFFSDSGSTAVEVAMKMAVQYWRNKGENNRKKFICFRQGYHGDTMGAMSLADPEGMHSAFLGFMPQQYVLDIPTDEYSFREFEDLMASGIEEQVAGMFIEPLVQGAGGMKFHSPDILEAIYRTCKKHDILFIADEIATGFGRTGSMFACEEAGITPDIMCVGKALTGGVVGLAATIATNEVFEAFLSNEMTHALMHGPTYMANPIACAAANASLDLFEQEPRLQQIEQIEEQLRTELMDLRHHSRVDAVRVRGAIGVVQLNNPSWDEMFKLRQEFVKLGVWLRPFADILYLTPAFTIESPELTKLTDAICGVTKKL